MGKNEETIKLKLDISEVESQLNNLETKISKLSDKKIKVSLDATSAIKSLTNIITKASILKSKLAENTTAKHIQTDLDSTIKKATGLKTKLLENTSAKHVQSDLENTIKKAKALKDKLKENTTATHTQTIKTVQTKALGGFVDAVRARIGRYFPGYGGGDTIPTMLEKGEYVHRKEAVKKLGLPAMSAINRGDLKELRSILSSKLINLPNMPALAARIPIARIQEVQKLAAGGQVQPQQGQVLDQVNVNLSINSDKAYKTTMDRDDASEFIKNIKRATIIHGRGKRPY